VPGAVAAMAKMLLHGQIQAGFEPIFSHLTAMKRAALGGSRQGRRRSA
jgi:hypothetical protein